MSPSGKWREEAMYRGQRIEHLEAVLARVESLPAAWDHEIAQCLGAFTCDGCAQQESDAAELRGALRHDAAHRGES